MLQFEGGFYVQTVFGSYGSGLNRQVQPVLADLVTCPIQGEVHRCLQRGK